MSSDRYCSILLLIFVSTGYSYEDSNELAKVSGATFAMQMKMLNKIANMMNIGKNESQIAVLQYAGFTRLEFGFSDHQSLDDLLNSLRRIRHMSGTTKTGKAMLKALELFQKAKHSEEQDVSQVAVVVTDGHSHDNPLPAAEALRAAGVTILTLGIGEHINRDEIVRISGKDELAFQDLHRNISLENFVAGFKNLSQGEHCEYARGSDGAQITCGPDFIQVEVSTNHKLKGRLFFEGFHGEPGCSSTDDSSRPDPQHARYDVRIRASHGKCGLANSRGFMVTSRAVLQFDRRFATINDHSFEIRCFHVDKRKKAKSPRRAEGVTTLVQDAVGTR
ncbi:von Willebrand factor type A domain protein [Ancylostoma caninum]|uniref:von Willebrand factor type A domain protein n=1 Tax=Ancylostoma caninum TaxID=29170 RepID=A0A368FV69_ANCCA|nr:von Willebrand factor type A domain protein [Ancylostoma caninum]